MAVMPHVDQIHLKDYVKARHAYAPMGEGDTPHAELLRPCLLGARDRQLMLTIETHVPGEQPAATRRSLVAVRRLFDVH